MDFVSVLQIAQQKTKEKRNDVNYYTTKFAPPKKPTKSKQLSDNIKKFLERKEQEEKQKEEEARKKKLRLLELRAQDKGSSRRVQSMLQRTKSANKSAIEDAVDKKNTAVTATGMAQPDEDDYGYESQTSAAMYQKMLEKYNAAPDENKFSLTKKKKVSTNLTGTKDRVKAALLKEEQEASMPHRRKRRVKTDGKNDEKESDEEVEEKVEERKKPKRPNAPPPMNFNDLLKLAEKKQFEPVVIETKKDVEGPLMTKKQKMEFEREQKRRDLKESRDNKQTMLYDVLTKTGAKKRTTEPGKFTIPRKTDDASTKITSEKPTIKSDTTKNGNVRKPSENGNHKTNKLKDTRQEMHSSKIVKTSDGTNGFTKPNKPSGSVSEKPRPDIRPSTSSNRRIIDTKPKPFPPTDLKPKSKDLKPRQFPPSDVKPRQFPPSDVKPRQFPPSDVKPKQFPPSDVKPNRSGQSRAFPPDDVRRSKVQVKKRRILDSDDEEYDSEMDDFIDDGPEDAQNYSQIIQQIFGYDKAKYRNVNDDDDEAMESGFSTIMKEDYISSKIGLMEDLEDIQKEQQEKRRKAMMKKRRVS